MPGGKKVPGASPKRMRAYEHIKTSYLDAGDSVEEAKKRAAMTVNAQRRKAGETKKAPKGKPPAWKKPS